MISFDLNDFILPENISFLCDSDYCGKIPQGVKFSDKGNIGFVVSVFNKKLYDVNLNLVPKKVCLGIGCKKDTPKENIEKVYYGLCW